MANGWDDRMTPEILDVRLDILLAVRMDLYLATEKWDLVVDISKYLAEKYPDQPQWWVHWANARLRIWRRSRRPKKLPCVD